MMQQLPLRPLIWIGSSTIISGNVATFFTEWAAFAKLGKFIPGVSVMHYITNLDTIFGLTQALLFAAGAGFMGEVDQFTPDWFADVLTQQEMAATRARGLAHSISSLGGARAAVSAMGKWVNHPVN